MLGLTKALSWISSFTYCNTTNKVLVFPLSLQMQGLNLRQIEELVQGQKAIKW